LAHTAALMMKLEVGSRKSEIGNFCFTKVAICEVNCYGNNASKYCNLSTLQ